MNNIFLRSMTTKKAYILKAILRKITTMTIETNYVQIKK